MILVLLAGGISKRMQPIKQDKLLLKFLGKPLFTHILENIPLENFEKVIVCCNENNRDDLEAEIHNFATNFEMVIQKNALGMADAILSAKEFIEGEVLISNADDLLDEMIYSDILAKAELGKADVILPGLKVNKYFPGGYLKLDGSKITGLVEKPGEGNEPSSFVKLVVDYFKDGKQLIKYLEKVKTEKDDVYEVALDQMIKDGLSVEIKEYSGIWYALKYPWHVLELTEYYLNKITRSEIDDTAAISETAVIEGKVIIEKDVKIFDNAKIKGPCYLGEGVIVGDNALVRDSIINEKSVIGFSTEVARSYIGPNCWFHTNYLGDSILDENVSFGSGAVTANLRIDNNPVLVGKDKIDSKRLKLGLIAGRGARIGVNASTMPGVKVGSNSLVGPGIVLREDLEDNKKLLVRQDLELSDNTPPATYDSFRDKLK